MQFQLSQGEHLYAFNNLSKVLVFVFGPHWLDDHGRNMKNDNEDDD